MQEDLKKIERAVVRLRNKLNRADLEYNVQAAISSVDPTKVVYAAQLTSVAKGLAPLTFIGEPDDLVRRIKATAKKLNEEEVEKAYHEAQIVACRRTIKYHEERVEEINNPTAVPEEVDEPED